MNQNSEEVEIALERLAAFPDENPNPVMELGSDGGVIYANPGSRALLRLLGESEARLDLILPRDTGAITRWCLDRQESSIRIVREIRDHIIGWSFHPVVRLGVVHAYGADITQHYRAQEEIIRLNAELEARVEERTRDLKKANEELEAFSYSLSHDMRSPVQVIRAFSNRLAEKAGPLLEPSHLQYIDTIAGTAERLERLIDDLLAYSTASYANILRTEVDLNAVFADAQEDVCHDESASRARWVFDVLPVVVGDPTLLKQVAVNLLSNAVKYSSNRESPLIRVDFREFEDDVVISVSDNGIGFDMARADKLFSPFCRLHDDQGFDGTGIGLALVERIIRRHGGRVGADARCDQGATFFFTLPHLNQAENDRPDLL